MGPSANDLAFFETKLREAQILENRKEERRNDRLYIAARAPLSLLVDGPCSTSTLARAAVAYADAVLDALEEESGGE